jgi:YHS domain-containing protein
VIRFLLLAILLLLIARAFWRVMDGILEAAGGTSRKRTGSTASPAVKLVRDPVCGTFVAPSSALSLTSGGSTHYFCSEDCRRKFTA